MLTRLAFLCCMVTTALAPATLTPAARADAPPADALPADTRLDLFLLLGQSNMAGRGPVEPVDRVPDPRVWMLAKDDRWTPAVDPMHFDKPKVAGVGPGRAFGLAVADARPGTAIGLVPCAVGGTSIEQWAKGGPLYADAVTRARAAARHGTFRAILWHQGEAQLGTGRVVAGYPAKLRALIADLRADLGTPDLPVIVGQLGRFHRQDVTGIDAFNDQLAAFAAAEAHCGCATSEGLVSRGDELHFDAASQRELGHRYAVAYLKLTTPATQPTGRRPSPG